MIKLVVGVMGTGKTKMLINLANQASIDSKGCVVCVERGKKLTFDIKHTVRLIDTNSYEITTADELYGFISGICANNYDVTDFFIDSALKICSNDVESFIRFIYKLDKMLENNHINCLITSSIDIDSVPDALQKFIYHH